MKNWISLLGAGLAGSAITLCTYKTFESDSKEVVITTASQPSVALARNMNANAALELDFSAVADKVTPAVVSIKSKIEVRQSFPQGMDPFRDLFGDGFFFGQPDGRQNPQQAPKENFSVSTGSGVVFSKDGYIVTNNHVVENAKEIEVILTDNRTYKAKVVGTDPSTDLAVIKIKETNLPVLAFGNSDNVKVGAWALAVGNPFNLSSTVTAGVVSAKGRNIRILKDQAPIESFIQTDAAINPGNSGGALVNINGDMIGINTAISSPTGAYSGYGFAVPSNLVLKVTEDILKYGYVQRGFLGILITDLDGQKAKEKNLDITNGIFVDSCMNESAAKDAGVKKGDVIVKVDGKSVKNSAELQEMVGRHRPGETLTLTINRAGKEMPLPVTLRNKDGKTEITKKENREIFDILGGEFEDLNEKDKKLAKVDAGVKVAKILPGGKLKLQTEMKEGFIITKVDKKPVKNLKELAALMQQVKGGVMIEGIYPEDPDNYYYALGL